MLHLKKYPVHPLITIGATTHLVLFTALILWIGHQEGVPLFNSITTIIIWILLLCCYLKWVLKVMCELERESKEKECPENYIEKV